MSETATQISADEAAALADAQRRLEEARARVKVEVGRPKESLEQQLERLGKKLAEFPIKPDADVVSAAHKARGSAVEALRKAAGIPPRHAYEIPDGEGGWHEKRAALVKQLGNGFLVAVTGPQGLGKTQLGSALIYAATAKNLPCKYATAMDFFIALKGTFDDGSKQSEAQVIASFVKPKLLVLDEMDERSESAWENRLLFHMINQRYNNLVDTVLISRSDEETFLNSLGKSIQSRIQETGGSVVCNWPSYREGAI